MRVNVDRKINVCNNVDRKINVILNLTMFHSDRLKRWAVVRLLANMQRVTIAQFAKESDADGYAKALHRLEPTAKIIVIFEPDHASREDDLQ